MVKMTIFAAYQNAKKVLEEAGIEEYGFEARQIIRHVTNLSNSQIITQYNDQLTPLQQTVYNDILNRRKNRYPLQYILGCWSFYGLEFFVGDGVLTPRADTEVLVDASLELIKGREKPQVLDLCSGSGCIAVAIAKNSDSEVWAVEKYDEAFAYLEKNIKKNGANVTALKEDIFCFTPDKSYDLIVSNPPYIAADEMEEVNPEATFEPDTALYGGEDGLMFYRFIAENYKQYLKKGGYLAFEVGFKQAAAVTEIMQAAGFSDIKTREDLNGIQRVVYGTLNNL
ncbi:MAG: peptide chain release factor N(5)-glutamine methyltransferase [Clostridiales bacterium]|nr:peptide chain release factor N(5)-glutamine methyltransferase [Candidatus Equinaster intestinalis]